MPSLLKRRSFIAGPPFLALYPKPLAIASASRTLPRPPQSTFHDPAFARAMAMAEARQDCVRNESSQIASHSRHRHPTNLLLQEPSPESGVTLQDKRAR